MINNLRVSAEPKENGGGVPLSYDLNTSFTKKKKENALPIMNVNLLKGFWHVCSTYSLPLAL